VEDRGEIPFEESDGSNIPVNVWLQEEEDDFGNKTGKWQLLASNYMPRKGYAADSAYDCVADTREELVKVVLEHVIPLYQAALSKLNALVIAETDNLYYWK